MKKFLLSVLLAAGCVALHAETPMVRQTRFEGRNITGVVAGSSFNVEVYQSDTTRAIVEIPAELQEFLIFQIDSQGVVTLGLDYSWKKKNNVLNEIMRSLRSNGAQMKAKIYITGLRVLKASSSARIRPMTPLTGNSAELGISSSGRIENLKLNATGRVRLALSSSGRLTNAEIAAQDLDCTLSSSSSASLTHHGKSATFGQSSSSRIDISGEVGSANIITSSSASFRGAGYNIGSATLGSSSSSRITVGVVQDLKATAKATRKRGRYRPPLRQRFAKKNKFIAANAQGTTNRTVQPNRTGRTNREIPQPGIPRKPPPWAGKRIRRDTIRQRHSF